MKKRGGERRKRETRRKQRTIRPGKERNTKKKKKQTSARKREKGENQSEEKGKKRKIFAWPLGLTALSRCSLSVRERASDAVFFFACEKKRCPCARVDAEQNARQPALFPPVFDAFYVALLDLVRKRGATAPGETPNAWKSSQRKNLAREKKKQQQSREKFDVHFPPLSPSVFPAKPPARGLFSAPVTHLCKAPRGPEVSAPGRGLLQHRRDAPPVAAVRGERPEKHLVLRRRPWGARARVRARAGLVEGARRPELGL